ncbi:hypothetical protein Dimus_004507 [Dionaea muscipula]
MKNKDQESKFMRIIAMPIRILAKARDLYVNSMNHYADRACYGGAATMGGEPLPRSFSTNSRWSNEEDDLRELVRAASTKALGDRIDLSGCLREQQRKASVPVKRTEAGLPPVMAVARSASVGMGKIDEDEPCEFGEDKGFDGNLNKLNKKKKMKKKSFGGLFPRSRSHGAVSAKHIVGF